MKIYVASSWRNPYQPNVVEILRLAGHEVYDFRHPPGGEHLGFSWSDVDLRWTEWKTGDYINALDNPIAQAGFDSDFEAMQWADLFVLVLPCGRSAHLETGWAVGQGKPTILLLDNVDFDLNPDRHQVTDLMYKMMTNITDSLEGMLEAVSQLHAAARSDD